jgi:MOSC domain-containing protein YiiM
MGPMMRHLATADLEAGLALAGESPADAGTVELIVARPATDERKVLETGHLDPKVGLVGDRWGESNTDPGSQLTLMNSRFAALIAGEPDRWGLAGDQLYVDFDLSIDNLPPGTRLQIGEAVVEVSEIPHTGCAKFTRRFGLDALHLTRSEEGRRRRLRGMYARVVEAGEVTTGDRIRKVL